MNNSLAITAKKSLGLLESCSICPRKCRVNRIRNNQGFCRTGLKPKVYSFMSHHGEEPPISGTQGSGAIFFSGCNMSCVYCQNFKFSQEGEGREVDFSELAHFMLELQSAGCHNINLVTPTHVIPQILAALNIAVSAGLKIPIIYNSSGYELPQTIRMLENIIGVYLVDMRYADAKISEKYSNAPDYPRYNQESVKEMHRQVGVAEFNNNDIIKKGLIIRHLVLPDNISGTEKIMKFIAEEVSTETYISLMSQYTPYYKAGKMNKISQRITLKEYEEAKEIMNSFGLYNGWTQDSYGLEHLAGVHIKSNLKNENKE